jgi:hypothetical protein
MADKTEDKSNVQVLTTNYQLQNTNYWRRRSNIAG